MTTWSTSNPVLAEPEAGYEQVAWVWASRITRNSPPFARSLAARHRILAEALEAALADLDAGTLRREGRDGL